mmetsp:Transcript_14438/g.36994  ORF Transcript_14438/g.36994 Transcript_14438/m.36994 type:complete len:268 (-) Transcript_14438:76-879(-)
MFTVTCLPSTSTAMAVIGVLASSFTSPSFVPSPPPNKPMYAGPRGAVAPTTRIGPFSPPGMKRTPRTAKGTFSPGTAYEILAFSSPLAMSQMCPAPVRSQDASSLPSALKSRSRISFSLPQDRCRVGSAEGLDVFHTLTTPSVPPVAIVSPAGEYRATVCVGSLPSSSDTNSQTCVSVFFSSENSRILQEACREANQRPFDGEYARPMTTLFSVPSEAMVLSFPVASSYRCACTTFGTSLEALAPPPPAVRKIWPPSLASPSTGNGG